MPIIKLRTITIIGISNMSDNFKLITPKQAWSYKEKNSNSILIDVRTDMEFLMIGHPKGAIHIPWMDAPDWEINKQFVAAVRKLLLGRNTEQSDNPKTGTCILLLCRSSNRSKAAARELAKHGINNLYVVDGGFEGPLNDNHHRSTVSGWRNEGLPWEQC